MIPKKTGCALVGYSYPDFVGCKLDQKSVKPCSAGYLNK